MLTVSPAGDEITADFASILLQQEQLGKGEVTDYLAVSFSLTTTFFTFTALRA
ncbi:alkaline phosphatase [Vibrio ishigakensis]|uniref:Alkaline phosphatase n=1 Tax=Vibrio ishigakensis TaxID=1481914 RepID=A0A0B8PHX1_9VIBR|nr:alkaline phosphatase [Vibrio ishigakensis]